MTTKYEERREISEVEYGRLVNMIGSEMRMIVNIPEYKSLPLAKPLDMGAVKEVVSDYIAMVAHYGMAYKEEKLRMSNELLAQINTLEGDAK